MNVGYIREANASYMTIENPDEDPAGSVGHALRMILNNAVPGFLRMKTSVLNGREVFYYDISSKTAMSVMFKNHRMNHDEVKEFMFGISRAVEGAGEYLLDINAILLDRDMIYVDPRTGIPQFCYCPGAGGDFFEDLKELLRTVLEMIDYDDTQAIEAAYGMQKVVVCDNFTIDDLLRSMGGQKTPDNAAADSVAADNAGNGKFTRTNPAGREERSRSRDIEKDLYALYFDDSALTGGDAEFVAEGDGERAAGAEGENRKERKRSRRREKKESAKGKKEKRKSTVKGVINFLTGDVSGSDDGSYADIDNDRWL